MGFHLLNRHFWLMTPTDMKTGRLLKLAIPEMGGECIL